MTDLTYDQKTKQQQTETKEWLFLHYQNTKNSFLLVNKFFLHNLLYYVITKEGRYHVGWDPVTL